MITDQEIRVDEIIIMNVNNSCIPSELLSVLFYGLIGERKESFVYSRYRNALKICIKLITRSYWRQMWLLLFNDLLKIVLKDIFERRLICCPLLFIDLNPYLQSSDLIGDFVTREEKTIPIPLFYLFAQWMLYNVCLTCVISSICTCV